MRAPLKHSKRALVVFFCACLALAAGCTPEYTRKTGEELAEQAGISDSVTIQRGNQRLLSHQGQVCLLSDNAGTEAGQVLLRTMQSAFSGYFSAVGVDSRPLDLWQAAVDPPCPSASYLFFVQGNDSTCADSACQRNARSEFIITIVNSGDQTLLDRVKMSVKNSWLPRGADRQERLKAAFERLAQALVGATPP